MIRSIQHPGVEIREIDKSQYAPAIEGTYCLVAGFTDKGEEYNPLVIGSISDYEAVFGQPTNEAERYHYYTSNEVIKNGGTLVAAKLPYNNTISTNYKYVGLNFDTGTTITSAAPSIIQPLTGSAYGYTSYAEISASTIANISTTDYDTIVGGGAFPAGVSSYDYLIVNENKASITGPETNEGVFVVIVDPIDAMNVQRMLENPADSDVMDILQGINSPAGIVYSDFASDLTGTYINSSVSEDLMKSFPTIEWDNSGDSINGEYSQYIGLVVCNTVADLNNEGKLNVGVLEAFAGSIHPTKRDKATGQSVYIGDLVNAGSNYIKLYKSSTATIPTDNETTILYKASGSYPLIGFTDAESVKVIQGASVGTYLDTLLEKVSNIDEIQLDLVVDGGLSTIAQFTDDVVSGTIFEPVSDVDSNDTTITSSTSLSTWRTVVDKLEEFCSKTRRDCMAIVDTPRNLVLQGDQKYIRKTAASNTFSNTIGNKLRYVTGINSSYAALYSNWKRVLDGFSGTNFWTPPTVKVAGVYVNNDRVANIWDAPAGQTRGVINGINDISFNPSPKDQDQLYIKSINYTVKYPLDGFVLEGQKTTQVKPSAFDRVNVRRLFLRLERLTYQVSRYFVYEINNLFTRRRLIDTLDPIFREYKNSGGLVDYRIVCSEENNSAEVIERNELKVAVLIKPSKAVDFILVDFVATRQDASFEEVLQEL